MSQIKKRKLGTTGLEITELGLGGVFIAERKGTTRAQAIRVVQRAIELGVTYIDTAPLYGNSQEIIGEALDGNQGDYLIGTKCGRWDWKTGPYRELDAFKTQLEDSLKLLRRDYVDILYIHEADWVVYWADMEIPRSQRHIELDASYDYAVAPVVQFLRWAKTQGLTKHIGISGNNAHPLAKVLRENQMGVDVVLVAFGYSLIWRNTKTHLLPVARELGAGVVLGAPLQQGRLAVPHEEWLEEKPEWMDDELQKRFRLLYELQKETDITLAELAIRFLLADSDFTTVIPGAATVEQLEENIRSAAAGPLPKEIHLRLDALGKEGAEYF